MGHVGSKEIKDLQDLYCCTLLYRIFKRSNNQEMSCWTIFILVQVHSIPSDDPISHLAFYTCIIFYSVFFPFYWNLPVLSKLLAEHKFRANVFFDFFPPFQPQKYCRCVSMKVCGEGLFCSRYRKKVVKKIMTNSFDKQTDVQWRCSILLNPTDSLICHPFWRFSSDSHFKWGQHVQLCTCCPEPLWKDQEIASDEKSVTLQSFAEHINILSNMFNLGFCYRTVDIKKVSPYSVKRSLD